MSSDCNPGFLACHLLLCIFLVIVFYNAGTGYEAIEDKSNFEKVQERYDILLGLSEQEKKMVIPF